MACCVTRHVAQFMLNYLYTQTVIHYTGQLPLHNIDFYVFLLAIFMLFTSDALACFDSGQLFQCQYSLLLSKCCFFSFFCSVPTFHGLQEDILSKLADVLEEVSALLLATSAAQSLLHTL